MSVAKGKAGPRGTGVGLGPHSLCRLIREKIIIALVAEPWGQCRAPSLPASAVLVWEQALLVCSHAELDGAVAGWGCGLHQDLVWECSCSTPAQSQPGVPTTSPMLGP